GGMISCTWRLLSPRRGQSPISAVIPREGGEPSVSEACEYRAARLRGRRHHGDSNRTKSALKTAVRPFRGRTAVYGPTVLTTRNPSPLAALPYLLRWAARRNFGDVYHDPPRTTWPPGHCPAVQAVLSAGAP